jgi:hypothetical protein
MTRADQAEALLREAVDAITVSRPGDAELVSRIALFLMGMCSSCGQRQDTPSCAGREHWLPVVTPESIPTCVFCQCEGHWSRDCPTLPPDLVWENYGSGLGLFRADMTGPRR